MKTIKKIPEGYKILKEGQANILYLQSKVQKDAEGFVRP
jgi:hypothetical protein